MKPLADVVKPTGNRREIMTEVFEGLPDKDKETFLSILEDPSYTQADLTRGLQEMGYDVTLHQVRSFASRIKSGGYKV